MDKQFWLQKWQKNEIGFPESEANPLLVSNFRSLSLAPNSRLFVPLCGKSHDIGWLLSQGHRVVGAELSELAIRQLFAELGVEPTVTEIGQSKRFSATDIDIFVGDMFDLSPDMIGPVDAIYDRAALVALPGDVRPKYAAHLTRLTDSAPQLLVCFEYDQTLMNGPPFSVREEEVARLYSSQYTLSSLGKTPVPGGFKGKIEAASTVWLLR